MSGWQRLSVVAMGVWTVLLGGFLWLIEVDNESSLLPWLAFWLTPPLLVFLLFSITRWIYRGFRDH